MGKKWEQNRSTFINLLQCNNLPHFPPHKSSFWRLAINLDLSTRYFTHLLCHFFYQLQQWPLRISCPACMSPFHCNGENQHLHKAGPRRFKGVKCPQKDMWDLLWLLQLLTLLHVSDHIIFWTIKNWRFFNSQFSIIKLFHLQKTPSKWCQRYVKKCF